MRLAPSSIAPSIARTSARLIARPCSSACAALDHRKLATVRPGEPSYRSSSPLPRAGHGLLRPFHASSEARRSASKKMREARREQRERRNAAGIPVFPDLPVQEVDHSSARSSPQAMASRRPAFKGPPTGTPDFTNPEPTGLAGVCRHLLRQLESFVSDEDGEAVRRLGTGGYGVGGEAIERLVRLVDPDAVQVKGPEGTRALLRAWKEEVEGGLEERKVRYKAKLAKQEGSTAGESWGVIARDGSIDVRAVAASFDSEGALAITRTLLLSFLHWVVRSLAAMPSHLSTTASDTLQAHLLSLLSNTDLRHPHEFYPLARAIKRTIHLHVGPTNSGKTYHALLALVRARTGVYAGPLRLLAHEVFERVNKGTIAAPGVVPPRACNLLTGEEQKEVDPFAGIYACTVEMVNLNRAVDVAVIDEIQMIGDPARGFAWTTAVLGVPAREIHLCGEASVVPLIRSLSEQTGDDFVLHNYERLSPLTVSPTSLSSDLSNVRRGDCVVTFARSNIFAVKNEIEARTGLKCAVAYGGLPPETRSEQARLFNESLVKEDGEGLYDVMVASDAIGMGLNLKINRVVFETVSKWDGQRMVRLSASQIKQIAGRAGRYGTKGGGEVTTLHDRDLPILEAALEAPLTAVPRAAIAPTSNMLSSLAQQLAIGSSSSPPRPSASASSAADESAPSTSLSSIFAHVALLSQVRPSTYYVSAFSQQMNISPLIEERSRQAGVSLTIAEKECFCNAPANIRDERVQEVMGRFVEAYGSGRIANIEEGVEGLDMMEALAEIWQMRQDTIRQRDERLAREGQVAATTTTTADAAEEEDGAKDVTVAGASSISSLGPVDFDKDLPPDRSALSTQTLMVLESLHRTLTLYLWLSYRYQLTFCHADDARAYKLKTEEAIEFCLEGIRSERRRRVSKRLAEAAQMGETLTPGKRWGAPEDGDVGRRSSGRPRIGGFYERPSPLHAPSSQRSFHTSVARPAPVRLHDAPLPTSPPQASPHTFAVLGGGISGLAATYYLARTLRRGDKRQRESRVVLLEAGDRLGGWIESKRVELQLPGGTSGGEGGGGTNKVSLLFESGPRSLRPAGLSGMIALDLISGLGLVPDLHVVPRSHPSAKNRFIYFPDRLNRLPSSLPSLLASLFRPPPVLKGVASGVLREPFISPSSPALRDESVDSFVSRRFGHPMARNLVSAVLHGIYAGDARLLSVRSVLPFLWDAERSHGGVLRALLSAPVRTERGFVEEKEGRTGSGPREMTAREQKSADRLEEERLRAHLPESLAKVIGGASIYSFRDGIQTLVDALERQVGALGVQVCKGALEGKVVAVAKGSGSGDRVITPAGRISADHVISALPSNTLDGILSSTPLRLPHLSHNHAVDVGVVHVALAPKADGESVLPVRGFGHLVPRSTPDNEDGILGIVYDSDSLPTLDRYEPQDRGLDVVRTGPTTVSAVQRAPMITKVTVMIGGAHWSSLSLDQLPTEAELVNRALKALETHLDVPRDALRPPLYCEAKLHRRCIPQYLVGHIDRMKELDAALRASANDEDNDGHLAGRLSLVGASYGGVSVNDCIRGAKEVAEALASGRTVTGLERFTVMD